jgi:hypothetical protein
MLPVQRTRLHKASGSNSMGNLPLTKDARHSHAKHGALWHKRVQHQHKSGKVILRRLLYTAVVWHKTLKRRLRIVVLLNQKDRAKPCFIVLGSTDPELNGRKLVELYASRFHIAFLFRDSTQFTGLLDGQARAESA